MMVYNDWIFFFGGEEYLIVYNLSSSFITPYRNMTYKDANNTIKHVLHTDIAYPGLQPQVQGGKDQWADIKPATDITSLNMRVLNYRSRQVLIYM